MLITAFILIGAGFFGEMWVYTLVLRRENKYPFTGAKLVANLMELMMVAGWILFCVSMHLSWAAYVVLILVGLVTSTLLFHTMALVADIVRAIHRLQNASSN